MTIDSLRVAKPLTCHPRENGDPGIIFVISFAYDSNYFWIPAYAGMTKTGSQIRRSQARWSGMTAFLDGLSYRSLIATRTPLFIRLSDPPSNACKEDWVYERGYDKEEKHNYSYISDLV